MNRLDKIDHITQQEKKDFNFLSYHFSPSDHEHDINDDRNSAAGHNLNILNYSPSSPERENVTTRDDLSLLLIWPSQFSYDARVVV